MTNASKKPKPPTHLRLLTRRWWASVADEWCLDDHHLKLLTLACEAWDRCQEAREALGANGLVYEDRFGAPRARPEVAVERDSRLAFARMLREINLDEVPPPETPRPPRAGGSKW
jgi:P27 family predicted phage terminase small subunit